MRPSNTIDPRDELWLAQQLKNPAPDYDGVCFAIWRGEQLGPFSCVADADVEIYKRMCDAGVEIVPGADCGTIIFADPAVYHVTPEGKLNG
jgi:hypothetical protein